MDTLGSDLQAAAAVVAVPARPQFRPRRSAHCTITVQGCVCPESASKKKSEKPARTDDAGWLTVPTTYKVAPSNESRFCPGEPCYLPTVCMSSMMEMASTWPVIRRHLPPEKPGQRLSCLRHNESST